MEYGILNQAVEFAHVHRISIFSQNFAEIGNGW